MSKTPLSVSVLIRPCAEDSQQKESSTHDTQIPSTSDDEPLIYINSSSLSCRGRAFTFDKVSWESQCDELISSTVAQMVEDMSLLIPSTLVVGGPSPPNTQKHDFVVGTETRKGAMQQCIEELFAHILPQLRQKYPSKHVTASFSALTLGNSSGTCYDLLSGHDPIKKESDLVIRESRCGDIGPPRMNRVTLESVQHFQSLMQEVAKNYQWMLTRMGGFTYQKYAQLYHIEISIWDPTPEYGHFIDWREAFSQQYVSTSLPERRDYVTYRFLELHGMERTPKTGAMFNDVRLREATRIGSSLSSWGNVISALADARLKHIPFRDSKLTRLMQEALTKTRVQFVLCADQNRPSLDETLSDIRMATRMKAIHTTVKPAFL